jgi:Leucine-rich repeat (LRR) protein
MKHLLDALLILTALSVAGCFNNREAPRRLITCTTLEAATAQRDGVGELDLHAQTFDTFPSEIATFSKLERLILRDARITNGFEPLARSRSLRMLDLSGMQLAEIPAAVFALSGLEHLYFVGNTATNLTVDFSQLPALTYLNLDRTPLEVLPDSIGAIPRLRWLRLNNTRLASLPESVGRLAALERLYLRSAQLPEIPSVIGKLAQLEDLGLSGNPISVFPDWLTALPRLRNLDLNDTRIAALPATLQAMKALRTLSLSRCPIPDAEKARIREALPACHVTF